ncbi:hypothetical protein OROGR_020764 [Orobanche gracilis]
MNTRVVDLIESLTHTRRATYDQLLASTTAYEEATNEGQRHLEFEMGDFMWAVLTRDRYLSREYNKLVARKIGHLEVIAKINQHAHHLHLPSHIRTSEVFNVKHLIPYTGGNDDIVDKESGSRANLFLVGVDDVVNE